MVEKRRSALIHVLGVSIILLAHAVIPHIHFHNEIVITGSEVHANKQDCNTNNHEHNSSDDTDADFCILKQVFLARSNNTDPGDEEVKLLKTQNDFPFALFIVLNPYENLFYSPKTFVSNKIPITSFYSFLGSGSINSRGSPLA